MDPLPASVYKKARARACARYGFSYPASASVLTRDAKPRVWVANGRQVSWMSTLLPAGSVAAFFIADVGEWLNSTLHFQVRIQSGLSATSSLARSETKKNAD